MLLTNLCSTCPPGPPEPLCKSVSFAAAPLYCRVDCLMSSSFGFFDHGASFDEDENLLVEDGNHLTIKRTSLCIDVAI